MLPPEIARQLLSNSVVRERVQHLMPEGLGDDEQSMVEVVNSPQFQQVCILYRVGSS